MCSLFVMEWILVLTQFIKNKNAENTLKEYILVDMLPFCHGIGFFLNS